MAGLPGLNGGGAAVDRSKLVTLDVSMMTLWHRLMTFTKKYQ